MRHQLWGIDPTAAAAALAQAEAEVTSPRRRLSAASAEMAEGRCELKPETDPEVARQQERVETLRSRVERILRAALDEQQREARRRIRELQSELDAERAVQERLERELLAGRERLSALQEEASQGAHKVNQMDAGTALAAARLEKDRMRTHTAPVERLQRLRLEEVRLRADLAEARRALRETMSGLRSALRLQAGEGCEEP